MRNPSPNQDGQVAEGSAWRRSFSANPPNVGPRMVSPSAAGFNPMGLWAVAVNLCQNADCSRSSQTVAGRVQANPPYPQSSRRDSHTSDRHEPGCRLDETRLPPCRLVDGNALFHSLEQTIRCGFEAGCEGNAAGGRQQPSQIRREGFFEPYVSPPGYGHSFFEQSERQRLQRGRGAASSTK